MCKYLCIISPPGGSTLGKYLSQVDLRYSAHFNDQLWKDTFEKVDSGSGRPGNDNYLGYSCHHTTVSVQSAIKIFVVT